MQPYFFPYIGYFQLAASVDNFVFMDDVAYIKGGWINRNRLFISGEVRYVTVPVIAASPNRKINELCVERGGRWRRKLLDSVRQSYSGAPHFDRTFAILQDVVSSEEGGIAGMAKGSVISVARHLGLEVAFGESGKYGNAHLGGVERVIDICKKERATRYLNLPGGRALYRPETFSREGIELEFVDPNLAPYPRLGAGFEPGLSMLDVLMFNDPASARRLLSPGAST